MSTYSLSLFSTCAAHRRHQLGFTLIEIMVVLAIIGGVLVAVAPRLVDRKTAMKSTVRELASVVREIHNNARLFNSTYRLVIDINDEKGHSFHIESAPGAVPLLTSEQQKLEDEKSEKQASDQPRKGEFSQDQRILKSPRRLPRNLFFAEVEYGNRPEPIQAGRAYIYFFPQGLTEEAVIHITDRGTLNWTIAVHPITGQADLFDGKKTLAELRVE